MTNIVLNGIVLVVLLAVCLPTLRRMRTGPVVWTAFHLCLLTMIFDTAMIAADLYVFDEDKILGIRVWGAPLEDFGYAIAASLAMPVLWTVLEGRAERSARPARPARSARPARDGGAEHGGARGAGGR